MTRQLPRQPAREQMKIWHDDIRRPPDETWMWARTNFYARSLLATGLVDEISLDHDLGLHEVDPSVPNAHLMAGSSTDDGYELVRWMIQHDYVPDVVTIHSMNVVGAIKMERAFNYAGFRVTRRPFSV